jgi:hypothetical protein
MKAYLVGGPANGRVIELPDNQRQVVVPEPVEFSLNSYRPAGNPIDFKTVVYRKSFQLRDGGYVFEVDEIPEPKPKLTSKEFGDLLKQYLRVNPGELEAEIKRAVRSMNLRAS